MPLTDACEMLRLDPPVLVSVTVCDSVAPSATLPKFSLTGFSVSCPGAAAIPVPESGRLTAPLDALLVTVSVPLKVPAAVGENLMLIVVLCPAAIVAGRVGAVNEKSWLEIETLLMVTEAGPEFVAVAVKVLLLPAATLPKLRLVLINERVLDCCWVEEPAALTPWQPTRKLRLTRRSSAPPAFPRRLAQIVLATVFTIISHRPIAPGSMTVRFDNDCRTRGRVQP